MGDLDLVRAAAQDVAAARLLLRQRQDAFEAISATALKHGISAADIASATAPEEPGIGLPVDLRRSAR